MNIFLSISFCICFGCSKESSHWDDFFEYPQHMFWSSNKKIISNYASYLKAWRIAINCHLNHMLVLSKYSGLSNSKPDNESMLCLIWFFMSQSTLFQLCRDRSSWVEPVLSRINVSCSRTQRSDASEAPTPNPSVSSQALYHWATALPEWVNTIFGYMGFRSKSIFVK